MPVHMGLLSLVVLIWLAPFIMVSLSSKVTGGEKVAWLLALFFISWFAWIFFLLLAPLKSKPV